MMALAVRQLHRSSEVMFVPVKVQNGKKLAIDSSFREVKLPREAFTDIEFHHSSYNFRRAGMCPRLDTLMKGVLVKAKSRQQQGKTDRQQNLGERKNSVAKYLSPALDDID
ncbi:hypothetical protein L6452_14874 [Arctium lappa]|uniref:Uncharacterized protein n=1 Tax=Arctium lappa TaxID=4217 RepID=A0ACB9CMH3_ARCLA|nr:hypothetical protein L6452_14874 [Arctium lappa]